MKKNVFMFLLLISSIILFSGFQKQKNKLKNHIIGSSFRCGFGYQQYCKNDDTEQAYDVTIKVIHNNNLSQKIIHVPAGGIALVGCSADDHGGGFSYEVVGESKG